MIRSSKSSVSSWALSAVLAMGLGAWSLAGEEANAGTAVPDLCVGTGAHTPSGLGKGACTYSDDNVPVLGAAVCWDGETAYLQPAQGCPARQPTYFAKYGEVVDPLSGEITSYAPLPSACTVVPCAPAPAPNEAPPLEPDDVACCDPETDDCFPTDANGDCPEGEMTWCKQVTANGDGTVTCSE